MHSNVFQTYSEQQKKEQFLLTMEALKVYAATRFKDDMEHLKILFEEIKTPSIPLPERQEPRLITRRTDHSDGTFEEVEIDQRTAAELEIANMIFHEKVKQYVKDESRLRSTVRALNEIVWGQCSRLMQASVRAMKQYEDIQKDGDVAKLLRTIRSVSTQISLEMNIYDAHFEAADNFAQYYQSEGLDITNYLKQFKHYAECA